MDLFLQRNCQEEPRKGQLTARFSDFYYKKSHIECYYFCQQCKDHFNTAGVTRSNRTPFATFFLCGRISFCQHLYKCQGQVEPLPWINFKAFLRKNLSDSQVFVNMTWSRVKRDSQFQQKEVQDWVSHLEYFQSIL